MRGYNTAPVRKMYVRYTEYRKEQQNLSDEQLKDIIDDWKERPLRSKLLNFFLRAYTNKVDPSLQAHCAEDILRERKETGLAVQL